MLQERVLSVVAELAPEARSLLLAVSGGPDSVALARLLAGSGYRLELAHFDHALREDSARDAAFVADLAASLSLPFHRERAEIARIAADKGWNIEEAARRLRYTFLMRTAKRIGADAVLTGHSLNDQAETVLMQLLRGAAFLQGMPARRGRLVRPLLNVSRGELVAFLAKLGQPSLRDPSNQDVSRTRAWVRHQVLPLLADRYPGVVPALGRLAELQRDQAEQLREEASDLLKDGYLATATLLRAGPALQRQAIRLLLESAGVPVDFEHIEALRAGLRERGSHRLSLPGGHLARLHGGRLEVVTPAPQDQNEAPALELPAEVDPEKAAAFADLVFRTRRAGDRIRLPGGTKKLKDLLIDRKVPREERGRLRVLASGSEVLWVEGVAADVRVSRQRSDADIPWMKLALEQARQAAGKGEVPVGAVVVCGGEVLGAGGNETEAAGDPSAHAEMLALRRAAARRGDWRLEDCTLYATLEPCAMCLGAALQAHVPRLVYGAANPRDGALGGVADLLAAPWKQVPEVRAGVLGEEASSLLSAFFEARRMAGQE